jgi:quinohemoprotein ethanol dehydrogenase
MPELAVAERKTAALPPPTADTAELELGAALYERNCGGCHGKDAVARYGGSVPDLRYASLDTHQAWQGIVIGGARRANGMPPFELTTEQSRAIRHFVISEAIKLNPK